MKTDVIKTDTPASITAAAAAGAEAIQNGKLVAFATETVYGIAALASDPRAIARLREVKSRPDGPFSVHVGSPRQVELYVTDIPLRARWLMQKGWPGPVTLLLPTGGTLAEPTLNSHPGLYETLTHDDVIGLRCPDQPVSVQMLRAVDGPVVAPSANPAGAPSPRTGEEVLAGLDGDIDLLIDSGPTQYGKDSTIVRFEKNEWEIIRQGVWDSQTIAGLMRRKIAFVCTGNTCRSPMAEGIAKVIISKELGVPLKKLKSEGVDIISAGVAAMNGAKASDFAAESVKSFGGCIKKHRSQCLTESLIHDCDVVFCMTIDHVHVARELAGPANRHKVVLLADQNVPDPIGGSRRDYDQIAELIDNALMNQLDHGRL